MILAYFFGVSLSLGLILNIVMSTSLGLIWSLMNSLQVIVFIPLINFPFPMNTVKFSVILMAIANFDILPHAEFNSLVFEFKDDNLFTEIRF